MAPRAITDMMFKKTCFIGNGTQLPMLKSNFQLGYSQQQTFPLSCIVSRMLLVCLIFGGILGIHVRYSTLV
jgi:hypothetical protein